MKTKLISTLSIFILSITTIIAGIPLAGNYTIDSTVPASTVNFPTFNAFADSINANGIIANVIVSVAPGSGPYMEQVVFSNISGLGINASVTLNGNGETISAITTTTNRHVIRLSNLQFFNISNLKVVRDTASTGGFYGFHIFGTGSNIIISGCEVDMTGTSSTLYGGYVASGSETSILETGDFHDISIIGNSSTGGGYGASVFGLISNLASNILISENSFNDFHSNGVYLRETNGAVVSNNNFDKSTSNVTSVNAIQVAQAANINAQIYNNRIRVGQISNGSVTFRGIYLFNGTGHKVYNNVIHDINLTSGNVTGIEIRTGGTAPEIYFNTISIDNPVASTGNLYGIKEELSNTNSIIRNNLISITQSTTGMKSGLVLGATATISTAFNSNYNDIWVPGGNTAMRGSLTPVFYQTLANWQSASTQDINSISVNPIFLSVAIPQPTNLLMDNLGITIPSITTDIMGVTRGSSPDIGAYEFNTVGINEISNQALLFIYPNPANDQVKISINNSLNRIIELKIYDVAGKLVINKINNELSIDLDISNLKKGFYIVKAQDESAVYSTKFLKL